MKATIMKNGKTYNFDIVDRSTLTHKERVSLLTDGYDSIHGEDLEDADFAKYEKEAASSIGITGGFLCKQL